MLTLADFTGAEFSREAVERIKVATAFDRPHIKRAAWVLTETFLKLFTIRSAFFPRVTFRVSLRAKQRWTIW